MYNISFSEVSFNLDSVRVLTNASNVVMELRTGECTCQRASGRTCAYECTDVLCACAGTFPCHMRAQVRK